jgi:tRNA dimethylallyltransferase
VVAGGTGLYLRAALTDLGIPSSVDAEVRQRWERLYDEDADGAYRRLADVDPRAAEALHPNDRRRVVRALELAETGASLAPDANGLWSAATRRPTLLVGLEVSTEELERRIVARTDAMLARGVVDEARRALEGPISHTARQALGLEELVALPVEEARERIIVRTRQYAAYQRKWMRRMPGVELVDGGQAAERVADAILDLARAG